MKKIRHFGTVLILLIGLFSNAQTIVWTGAASDNNFFTEGNWKDSVTNVIPAAGTIDPATNINLALQINTASATITGGAIQFGTGSLVVGSANLAATSLSGGTVTINAGGYVDLSSATPFLNAVQINFTSGIGWIRTPNYKASAVSASNLGQIKVNSAVSVYQTNLRLDHYYLNGCVIRANLASTTPLTVYDSANLVGTPVGITVNTLHKGVAIAGTMNNKIESFILKKGFMATFANETDGTGKSKNYIASEEDLVINTLPAMLQNSISFIRVMPWNWVTKKGRTDIGTELNTTWVYKWNNTLNTTLDWEYAPMSWGGSAAEDADIPTYTGKYNSTHVMSFNEPDDCLAQSGQYGNLCQTDVAVSLHKNLMKTGMRIVSPGGREEAPFGWLEEFYNKAKEQDIRIDVIAVHWYDWGNDPKVNTNPTDQQVFDRFKAYLTNVHNLYGLPIWITEFNANPARSQTINAGFLALALPYLETLDYVERYNWFPYNSGTHFSGWDDTSKTEVDQIPSLVGTIYKNINNTTPVNSTPSIPENTVNTNSNLNLTDNTNIAYKKPVIASSAFSTNVASKAVDGDGISPTSQWQVNLLTNPLPASLEVDLQGSFTVDSFRIFEQTNALKNFTFEVWNATTSSWNTVLTVPNNPATPLNTFKPITPVTTTRVRLVITAHNSIDYLKMYELEVYGVPTNPTWTGATGTNWATASNWSNGIVPDKYSNVTIAGGTPNQPEISANSAINLLTINSGATLTVNSDSNLTVTDAITNNGIMTINNNANLIQGNNVVNTGAIAVKRNSNSLFRLDYTLWCSPVLGTQTLANFSPLTTSTRFYTYIESTDKYNPVSSAVTLAKGKGYLIRMPNTDPLLNYDAGTAALAYPGVFTGVPNNGDIQLTFTKSLNGFNAIGNPYPSTLDANAFINANLAVTGTLNKSIDGTLYFWRKKNNAAGTAYATYTLAGGVPNSGGITPSQNIQVGQGFFVKNSTGIRTVSFNNSMRLGSTFYSVATGTVGAGWSGSSFASPGYTHTSGTATLTGSFVPTAGKSYQIGYRIIANASPLGSISLSFGGTTYQLSGTGSTGTMNITSATANSLVITPTNNFNGSVTIMYIKDNTSVSTSGPFLKTKAVSQSSRVWLNLSSGTEIVNQMMVAYMDGATQGLDNGIDGEYINDTATALTSDIAGREYVIQGRPTFDATDRVALNFKTYVDGEYTIALDHFDGVFANGQDIYLVDSKTGAETDLKATPYTFTAVAGVDNARFSLKYQKTLNVEVSAFNENSVRVYKNNGTFYVNSGTVAINNIKVYDIQGRLIAEQKNVKATTATIKDLKAKHQVLIVKITGEDANVVSKKVVN